MVDRNFVEKKLSLLPANQSARHGSCSDSSCWPPGTENSVPNLARLTAAWATSGNTPPSRASRPARMPSGPRAPGEHQPAPADHECDAEPDGRSREGRGERRCGRTDQSPIVGEARRGPLDDQGDGDEGQRECPQLGFVVDADPPRREQCRRAGHRCGEHAHRPAIVPRRAGTHDTTRRSGQPRRPAAHHDHGDQHRASHQPGGEHVAEQLERHAHDRQERPVVQVGTAVDQEALRPGHGRIDREAAAQEDPRLLVVEVGAEPGPGEQVPRLPRRRHQPEHGNGGDRDQVDDRRSRRSRTSGLVGGDGRSPHTSAGSGNGSSSAGAVSSRTTNW